jgi:undecaprenyl-diphosphatase
MHFYHAIILGIIEGLTEFLPISSTGHLILFSNLLQIPQTEFLKSFEIIIQLGAILAVVVLYTKKIIQNKNLFLKLVYSFIPTAIIGLLVYKYVKILLGNPIIVPIALIIGGIIILLAENFIKNKKTQSKEINTKESIILGIVQTLAFIPGVSRSGAIIIGGLLRNIPRTQVVEFSFMLAIPTMLAATGLDLFKNGLSFTSNQWSLLSVGFITSFIVAIVAIKTFLNFITNHSFKSFGWYRIIIGAIFLFILT